MAQEIEMTDVNIDYVSMSEAKDLSGLRLILLGLAVPGPWHEACKALFHVKGIPYTPVDSAGLSGGEEELRQWTGQTSSPVAIWNDEKPRSTWLEQLALAERIEPNPNLVPESSDLRIRMIGLMNEICGENGFGWNKRLIMIHSMLTNPDVDADTKAFWGGFGQKYGYSEDAAGRAPGRMVEVLETLDSQLKTQRASGSSYLIGEKLSAVDLYWAAFAAIVNPLPEEQCPMATGFRMFYATSPKIVEDAVTPELLEHRDYVYENYLDLPIKF